MAAGTGAAGRTMGGLHTLPLRRIEITAAVLQPGRHGSCWAGQPLLDPARSLFAGARLTALPCGPGRGEVFQAAKLRRCLLVVKGWSLPSDGWRNAAGVGGRVRGRTLPSAGGRSRERFASVIRGRLSLSGGWGTGCKAAAPAIVGLGRLVQRTKSSSRIRPSGVPPPALSRATAV